MQFAIPPNVMLANAQSGAALALQPGETLTALVLQVLNDGKMRIAIANKVLEVVSQLSLEPGTRLPLVVRSTPGGLALELVEPAGGQGLGKAAAPGVNAPRSVAPPPGTAVAQAALAPVPGPATAGMPAADTGIQPAPAALTRVVQEAAARQNSLAPLFANGAEAVEARSLPVPVQAAIGRLLAYRTPTAAPLTADDVQQAFSRSGLFLEARMAAAASGAGPVISPDLKAALLTLRQVLTTWLDALPAPVANVPLARQPGGQAPAQYVPQQATSAASLQPPAPGPAAAVIARAVIAPGNPDGAPDTEPGPQADAAQVSRRQPSSPLNLDLETAAGEARTQTTDARLGRSLATLAQTLAARALASPLASREVLMERALLPPTLQSAPPLMAAARPSVSEAEISPGTPAPAMKAAAPPPPYPGAPMSPQGPALAAIAADADPRIIGERLLAETDAALARQTLLQAASLPEGPEGMARDTAPARWMFEIPLATPQGTAIAQFEIARDGRRDATRDDSDAAWRARFSLDLDPLGPVHVQISLNGARAAVTLWAERAATAARMREDAPLLAQALAQAELEPGDVLVRNGAPPRPAGAAGRFLDRAS